MTDALRAKLLRDPPRHTLAAFAEGQPAPDCATTIGGLLVAALRIRRADEFLPVMNFLGNLQFGAGGTMRLQPSRALQEYTDANRLRQSLKQ